jgi:RimJ/RimL family protein N-acetyltransferase
MELRDDRVTLRRFRLDDAPRIVEACSDLETVRFVPLLPVPYTTEDALDYLRHVDQLRSAGARLPFAIADAGTDALLGAIDLRLGEVGSIGYWVHPQARGSGIATRALALLSRWAVTEGGVARLELLTHPENLASQRVAEKCGFVREGVLRAHLRFREGRRDSVMFSLLPADVLRAATR